VVYGSLKFLSPRNEAALDDSEGVPWLYEKQWHEVARVNGDNQVVGKVKVMIYVDVTRQDEGAIAADCVALINKAIRETVPLGLPRSCVDKYLRPWMPKIREVDENREIELVRVMRAKAAAVA
ncbi:hypothetical protein EK21DRAFT_75638, partial [Setomelanomma holmii]